MGSALDLGISYDAEARKTVSGTDRLLDQSIGYCSAAGSKELDPATMSTIVLFD